MNRDKSTETNKQHKSYKSKGMRKKLKLAETKYSEGTRS